MIIKLNIQKQRAFTLVEVMVAMVIFSVGLLGLAGLQALGMTNNQTALYRTIAMQQAYNMGDRMRNNITGVNAGSYSAITTTTGAPTDCITATCTPTTLALFDKFEWNTNNASQLPQGRGSVTVDAATGQFVVCVMWNELKVAGVPAEPDCTAPAAYDPTTEFKFYALRLEL